MVSVAAVSASQTPELRATARETAAATAAAATSATITTLVPPSVRDRRDDATQAPSAAPNRRPPSAPPVTRDAPQNSGQSPQQQSGQTSSTLRGQFGAFVAQLLGQQSASSASAATTVTPARLQQATATYQAVTDLTGKQQTADVQVPGLPASLSSGHVFDLVV